MPPGILGRSRNDQESRENRGWPRGFLAQPKRTREFSEGIEKSLEALENLLGADRTPDYIQRNHKKLQEGPEKPSGFLNNPKGPEDS